MKKLLQLLLCAVLTVSISLVVTAVEADSVEPEVTITHNHDDIIEEHRVNGHLFMIKVTPRKGFTYYLVDTDGDGSFDSRKNELDEGLLIPQWTLFSW